MNLYSASFPWRLDSFTFFQSSTQTVCFGLNEPMKLSTQITALSGVGVTHCSKPIKGKRCHSFSVCYNSQEEVSWWDISGHTHTHCSLLFFRTPCRSYVLSKCFLLWSRGLKVHWWFPTWFHYLQEVTPLSCIFVFLSHRKVKTSFLSNCNFKPKLTLCAADVKVWVVDFLFYFFTFHPTCHDTRSMYVDVKLEHHECFYSPHCVSTTILHKPCPPKV